jgi:hypothetical protein
MRSFRDYVCLHEQGTETVTETSLFFDHVTSLIARDCTNCRVYEASNERLHQGHGCAEEETAVASFMLLLRRMFGGVEANQELAVRIAVYVCMIFALLETEKKSL